MTSAAASPPLCEPGPELSPEEKQRYQRHFGLPEIGVLGQRRLKNARVLCVGAGGLGSPALSYLAAAGVGVIGLVDDDVVDLTNLQRQVIHGTDDLGIDKVASAAAAVRRLNPHVEVIEHRVHLDADNALEVVRGYDLVLDGADNFATRYVVSDAAEILGTPVVWGAILRFHGQISVFWAGRGPTYRDLFPEPPAPGSVPSCAEAGVLGAIPGVIGSLMAVEALKLITGSGTPLIGRLLVYDALAGSMRTLSFAADPARTPVTEMTSIDSVCAVGAPSADETLDVSDLRRLLQRRDADELDVALVDVREDWERDLGIIPGAVGVPLGSIIGQGYDALPQQVRRRELVLYCQKGIRSATALERLRPSYAGGEVRLRHLAGGMDAWARSTQPGNDLTAS